MLLSLTPLILLALAILAPPAAAARRDDPAAGPRLRDAAGLGRFFAALDGLERHRQQQAPVRILQIGDSHTANDSFSGRLRARLQGRFGDAGRGWLAAGIPFKAYNPHLVTVAETGWRHEKPGAAGADLPLGLDAIVAESTEPAARMTLASTDPGGFDRIGLEFRARPDGPVLSLRPDPGAPVTVPTAALAPRIRRVAIDLPVAAHALTLSVEGSEPAALLGWSVERRGPGIIYENHGTIGATVALLDRIGAATVALELADDRPALIVVAFGTNEGFDDTLDPAAYAARFRGALAALRRAAPEAAFLVLGPPDGERLDKTCRPPIAREPVRDLPCDPLPLAPPATANAPAAACAWHPPPRLAAVRRVQLAAAAAAGAAFWDWSAALGGVCSMDRLLHHDPPLAFADHVHLTSDGYAAAADLLFGDLSDAYAAWRRHAPGG